MQPRPAAGPAGVVRVGLTNFRWPIDPALAEGRDETTLARTLYATPLRTNPLTGAIAPGLCTAWKASRDFRKWTFTCRGAPSIATALRRVARLRDAPARWLFADAARISAGPMRLFVQLRFPWRRFPFALTAVGAAPRSLPGPFRLVSGSRNRVVARRPGLTVVFHRLSADAAVRAFRRGELDESPVPVGDIVAAKRDSQLARAVRVRNLTGLDLVVFRKLPAGLRRVYWETANRADYEELVPEQQGAAALGLVGTDEQADPARFRRSRNAIPSLPRVLVRFGVPDDPTLRFGARLLYAQWRDFGLGPQLVAAAASNLNASFLRVVAAYPQEEAIPAEVVLRDGAGSRTGLVGALAAATQHAGLERLDDELRASATVVPVARVVDARLVSPRLTGWREDLLGNVDYAGVRSRASSRRP
jgi:hypothetical protein